MFKLDKTTGDITCFQGDSGELFIYNAPDNSTISFSVYNSSRKIIFEIFENTNNVEEGKTRIFIPADDTDKLTVPRSEENQEYYYGIKITSKNGDERIEKTYLIGDSTVDDLNILLVYPKRNEGKNDL